ncbi:MAG: LysM peptidoglycan-binding domain-containing protein, partial [Rhodanobacter sp.]|nr:LysM peptidoglycan-binding domain-containing protein [Rhodanobacter sp.]
MTSRQARNTKYRLHQRAMWIAVLLALLEVSGCAEMSKLKQRFGGHANAHTSVVFTPAAQLTAPVASAGNVSLSTIVNDQLEHGHYAEGEQALRRYLAQHPGDHAAQAMLRQLTVDPERMLGQESRSHVVEAGDSYSSLAAHYLGDPGLFVVLARYNHASDPSVLRLGEKLRLPIDSPGTDNADRHAPAEMPAGSSPPAKAAETPPAAE